MRALHPAIALALAVLCLCDARAEGPPPAAALFDFADVRLLDSPFREASERNAEYLLSLSPDRLLHNTRQSAGLEPKAEAYGGWESRGIAGHTLGHYLTALSQQLAASGDARFRKRIDYLVAEMAEAQDAYGDGYVGALPPLELETLRGFRDGKVEVENPFVFASGAWVPWYTEDKILTGLRDAWVIGGNEQAKTVALRLADWVHGIVAGLSAEQLRTMLSVEHGGMRAVLMDLYARTGEARYLDAARRFRHAAVLEPLARGEDALAGLHANTQIPKIVGAARAFEVTGEPESRHIAENFWQIVTHEHSWVIGGNSEGEHFFPADDAASHLTGATAEACNTYNMLKLTEHLFTWRPSVAYADYYERALYNHILASEEPEHGMFAYFMSLEPGHFRTYSTPFDSFWCCVGSGMESNTKYGRAIYFHGDDELYVNLFIPSVVTWQEQGLVLEQQTAYPRSDRTELVVRRAGAAPLDLRVRAPAWADGALELELNGEPYAADARPGQYVSIRRVWRAGDRLAVTIPLAVRTEPLRGAPESFALLYGPLVLAGDLGAAPRGESVPYAEDQAANLDAATVAVPLLVGKDPAGVAAALVREPGPAVAFRAAARLDGREQSVRLRPFYELYYRRYNVYWSLAGPSH